MKPDDSGEVQHLGMTKREVFAGLAMMAILMRSTAFQDVEELREKSYRVADAMIAGGNK